MTELMYFETAPINELCDCVSVELDTRQSALLKRYPEQQKKIVNGALGSGNQRYHESDCKKCDSTGVKPLSATEE
jgi:hypothetical protein